jgi:hypothetical protein
VGVAWSAWPGRDPISTGHDRQTRCHCRRCSAAFLPS